MLCQSCQKNEATVHLTQVVAGETKKVDLCQACSKEKGLNDPAGFSLADLLMGMGENVEPKPSTPSVSPEKKKKRKAASAVCLSCGYNEEAFQKSGRLGCPDCYTAFGEGVSKVLKSMHRGIEHVGKVPERLKSRFAVAEKIRVLEQELDEAVASENYEKAAKCRDEIREIKDESASESALMES